MNAEPLHDAHVYERAQHVLTHWDDASPSVHKEVAVSLGYKARKSQTSATLRKYVTNRLASEQPPVHKSPVGQSTLDAFTKAMEAVGLVPPDHIVADGAIHRCGTDGKPYGEDGAYLLRPDGSGGCQNWREGDWHPFIPVGLTPEQLSMFIDQTRQHAKAAKAERAGNQNEVAARAARTWDELSPAPADHPYLVKKKIKPHGARMGAGGELVVSVINAEGAVRSLQTIAPDGAKRFMTGGEKAGNFHVIGNGSGEVVVCEGFATGASIHEATGKPVMVAFDAGNLLAVAAMVRKLRPDARIFIAADDDHGTGGNPGKVKAMEAAMAVNAVLAVPWPAGDAPEGQTDFNDLANDKGAAAVQEAFMEARYVSAEGPVQAALTALQHDPGAVFGKPVLASLRNIRANDLAEWVRIRDAVKKSGKVTMTEFDKATIPSTAFTDEEGVSLTIKDDDPWPEPVDGAALLDELVATLRRFVVADDSSLHAAALWILATHFTPVVQYAPILNITAPEKRCGKSTLLNAVAKMSCRSLSTVNISVAAVFHCVDEYHPTLMLDEVDILLRDNEDLRGLLNSGVTRGNPFYRLVKTGDNYVVKAYDVFGFKALCGIGEIADTLVDRSIPVRLKRKLPNEKVENIRYARDEGFDETRSKAARFAKDNTEKFATIRPARISSIHDRANDCWEPLLKAAELAGMDWLAKATTGAIDLMGGDDGGGGTNSERRWCTISICLYTNRSGSRFSA